METVMVRGRYKIVRVLEAGDDYAFAEAVDITERETPVRLLNIYEGAWLPIYARLFSEIKDCPAFCEAFLAEESLTAVFRPCGGVPIDRVFYRGRDLKNLLSGELALLASDHARKILAPRFRQGDAERAFCRRLERGDFPSIVPLYAGWHRAVEEITVEYEALDQKNAFKRWFAFLWKNIKRAFRRNRR